MSIKYYASHKHMKAIQLQDWQDTPDESYHEIDLPLYTKLSTIERLNKVVDELAKGEPTIETLRKLEDVMRQADEAREKYRMECLNKEAVKHGFGKGKEEEFNGVSVVSFTKGEDTEADTAFAAFMGSTIPVPANQLLAILAFLYAAGDNTPDKMRGNLFRLIKDVGMKQHVVIEEVGSAIAISISK